MWNNSGMQVKRHLHNLEVMNVEMYETTTNIIYVRIFGLTQTLYEGKGKAVP